MARAETIGVDLKAEKFKIKNQRRAREKISSPGPKTRARATTRGVVLRFPTLATTLAFN